MMIYKTTHPIYSTSISDNVATFNILLRLILEMHLWMAPLLIHEQGLSILHLEVILRKIVLGT